jgi:hypothetical protein
MSQAVSSKWQKILVRSFNPVLGQRNEAMPDMVIFKMGFAPSNLPLWFGEIWPFFTAASFTRLYI